MGHGFSMIARGPSCLSAAVLAAVLLIPADAWAGGVPSVPAAEMANELLSSIGGSRRIAVRPFRASEVPIDAAAANAINDELLDALIDRNAGRHAFVTRQHLAEIMDENGAFLPDFGEEMLARLLQESRADVLVVGTILAVGNDSIRLAYKAYDLKTTDIAGSAKGQLVRYDFSAGTVSAGALTLDGAVEDAAKYLVAEAHDALIVYPGAVFFQDTEIVTAFGKYVGSRVLDAFLNASSNPIAGWKVRLASDADGLRQPKGVGHYAFFGSYWVLGGAIELRLALRDADGGTIAWRKRIRRDTIPEKIAVVPLGGGLFQGIGKAAVGGGTAREEALQRSRNQARRMAVEKAMGRNPGDSGLVRDAVATMRNLEALSNAITFDEEWQIDGPRSQGGERLITAHLTTRVRLLGGKHAPAVRAALRRNRIVTGDALLVDVRSPDKAYLGLFAWGADDKVLRVFPMYEGTQVIAHSGETVTLPPQEGSGITSVPLPGNRANTEALVLIAGSRPMDFTDLVRPLPGGNLEETMAKGAEVALFSDALSKLDPRFLTVRILPYEVSRQ